MFFLTVTSIFYDQFIKNDNSYCVERNFQD